MASILTLGLGLIAVLLKQILVTSDTELDTNPASLPRGVDIKRGITSSASDQPDSVPGIIDMRPGFSSQKEARGPS